MRPECHPGEYAFVTADLTMIEAADYRPIALFQEAEGLTLVLRSPIPNALSKDAHPSFKMITLSVHSSLEAVGFLAAVTSKLAAHGISVNPISAFFHDHLFVPADKAAETMKLLDSFATDQET